MPCRLTRPSTMLPIRQAEHGDLMSGLLRPLASSWVWPKGGTDRRCGRRKESEVRVSPATASPGTGCTPSQQPSPRSAHMLSHVPVSTRSPHPRGRTGWGPGALIHPPASLETAPLVKSPQTGNSPFVGDSSQNNEINHAITTNPAILLLE